MGVGLALVARDSIQMMYGIDSDVAVQTMELLSITGCIVGLGFATGDLLFAIGRPGVMMRLNLVMVPTMLARHVVRRSLRHRLGGDGAT